MPFMKIRGADVPRALSDLQCAARLDPQRLQDLQLSKLKELLNFAYHNVPFYRKRFQDSHLTPADIRSLKDITKLPVLTKEDIRNSISDLQVRGIPARVMSTSGSSGYPLTFPKDYISLSYWDAAMYMGMAWHGIRIGDKQARFWGTPIHWRDRLAARFKDAVMNRIRISAFDVSDDAFYAAYARLSKVAPNYIYGYPSLVYRFCSFLEAHSLSLTGCSIRAAVLTGEILYPFQRELIQSVLQCRVVNEFGSTENGVIAFECPRGGMHIFSPNVLIEVIKDGRPADWHETGELYITELNSRSIAFIRYRTLDMGSLTERPCDCGLQYPLFHQIYGRVDNFIVASDGSLVYDAILAYTLKKYVDQFHAVQEPDRTLVITLRPNKAFRENQLQNLFKDLRRYLGEDTKIQVSCVDQFPLSAAGKLRYFEQRGALPSKGPPT